jgi:hypothetical protein
VIKRNDIGFTGTQSGMTLAQKIMVAKQIAALHPVEVHHGDCIGADSDFHKICEKQDKYIHIHPPINNSKRAFCDGHLVHEPREYLDRNHDIVDESYILIATPSGPEKQRSGTWATIRYAKKKGIMVIVVYPDGNIEAFKEKKLQQDALFS